MNRRAFPLVITILTCSVLSPTTSSAGIAMCTDDFTLQIPLPAMVRDGVGGVVVLCDHGQSGSNLRVCPDQHVDAQNAVTPWPAAGAPIPGFQKWATSDSAGGVIALWVDATSLLASRWDATGALASGWPAAVTVDAQHAVTATVLMTPDGQGGAFAA